MWYVMLAPSDPVVVGIDVGQGDATLVMINGHTILIDTGGVVQGEVIALDTVVPVLRYYGVNRLDYVVITHSDLDHIGGLDVVRSKFWVDKLITASSVPQELVVDGMDFRMSIVNPVMYYPSMSENDRSLLVKLQIYDWDVMITGDMSDLVELSLLRYGVIGDIDILKWGIMVVLHRHRVSYWT